MEKRSKEVDKLVQEKLEEDKVHQAADYKDLPSTFIDMTVKIYFDHISFEFEEEGEGPITTTHLDKMELDCNMGLELMLVSLELKDFLVEEHKLKNPLFSSLVETDKGDTGVLLRMVYDYDPSRKINPTKISMVNEKKLKIVANMYVLQYLSTLMSSRFSGQFDFENLQSYMKGEVYKALEEGKKMYQDMLNPGQHQGLEVDCSIKAPKVIVPLDALDFEVSSYLSLNLGNIVVKTDLAELKPAEELENLSKEELKAQIYDKYSIQIDDFDIINVVIGEKEEEFYFLEDFIINIDVNSLIDADSFKEHPTIHTQMSFPDISVCLNEQQVEFFYKMLTSFEVINRKLAKITSINTTDQTCKTDFSSIEVADTTSVAQNPLDLSERHTMHIQMEIGNISLEFTKLTSPEETALLGEIKLKRFLRFDIDKTEIDVNMYENGLMQTKLSVARMVAKDGDCTFNEELKEVLIGREEFSLLFDSDAERRFLDLEVKMDAAETKVRMDISKVYFIVNFEAFTRIAAYFEPQMRMSAQYNAMFGEMENQNTLTSKIKTLEEEEEPEQNKGNSNAFSKLANKYKKGLETKIFKAETKLDSVKQKCTKTVYKSKTQVSMKFCGIETILPYDCKSRKDTDVLRFKFNGQMRVKMESETEDYYHRASYLAQVVNKSDMTVSLCLYDIDFEFLRLIKGKLMINSELEKVLNGFRVSVSMDSKYIHEEENYSSATVLSLEPVCMTMGIRQVILLQDFQTKFYADMDEMYKHIPSNYNQTQENQETVPASTNLLTNVANYNNRSDTTLSLQKCIVKLVDNTGTFQVPVLQLELSRIGLKYITNDDPCDVHNMKQALLSMMSNRKMEGINHVNLYEHLDATNTVEVKYFNQQLNDWEHLIEPFTVDMHSLQVIHCTRRMIKLNLPEMVNFNASSTALGVLSLASAKLNYKQDQFKEYKGNWVTSFATEVQTSDSALEIRNNTGIPFSFWFDSDPSNMRTLSEGQKIKFSKKELSVVFEKVEQEELYFAKKNKFSLRFSEEGAAIEGVAFDNNQFIVQNGKEKTEFGVLVKVETIQGTKVASVESNLVIHNNSPLEISLFSSESDKLLLKPESYQIVPLSWAIADSKVEFCIAGNEDKKKELLTNLSELTKASFEFEKANSQKKAEKREKLLNTLNKQYSKVIELKNTDDNFFFAIDYLFLKSNADSNTINYLVLNPTVVFDNLIPYEIELFIDSENKKYSPLKSTKEFDFDFKAEESSIDKLTLQTQMNLFYKDKRFKSEKFDILNAKNKKIELINLQSARDKFEICVEQSKFVYQPDIQANFVRVGGVISSSVRIEIFADFLVVNRTKEDLFFRAKGSKEEEPHELFSQSSQAGEVSLFTYAVGEPAKVQIKTMKSEWSEPFSTESTGVEGETLLKEGNNIRDLAVKISSSSYFYRSTVIFIEPKFVVVNQTELSLFYRQKLDKDTVSEERMLVEPETKNTALLKETKNKTRIIQFGLSDFSDADLDKKPQIWSSFLSISSVSEETIKLPLPHTFESNSKSFSYDSYYNYALLQVSIKTVTNGTLFVIVSRPENPSFLIENTLNCSLKVNQKGTEEKIPVQEDSIVPYCWADTLQEEKKLIVSINGTEVETSFETLEKKQTVQLEGKEIIFYVTTQNNNLTRKLTIYQVNAIKKTKTSIQRFTHAKPISHMSVDLSMFGFGLSVIDEYRRELFYISSYKIKLLYSNSVLSHSDKTENIQNIQLFAKNFQIDYCLEDSQFKMIMHPKTQFIPIYEAKHDEEECPPFFQMLVTMTDTTNTLLKTQTNVINQIDLIIQEIKLSIDQSTINTLMQFASTLPTGEVKRKDSLENLSLPWEFDPYLSPNLPSIELLKEHKTSNMYIEALFLASLKISISLRIDISSLDIFIVPGFVTKIIGSFGNALARITDSPLRFTEVVLTNAFTSSDSLAATFQKHYTSQGVMQFYKILGSSDLIGNPMGLIDKLGTGVFEFFNEPRKGFLQGPAKFGTGILKGVNSLVSNIIGGSVDTISRITGSLYGVAKNIQGQKVISTEEDEPGNVFSGVGLGVYGGVKEIYSGITGIFTNPYESAKEDGVSGFFIGVGKGILGAVVAPFAAVFKISTSMLSGLKNTVTMFQKGKLKTERFRHPRVIEKNKPVTVYDDDLAEATAILKKLSPECSQVVFYSDFVSEEKDYAEGVCTIVLSQERIYCVHQAKDLVFKVKFSKIVKVDVHEIREGVFILVLKKSYKQRYIITKNLSVCAQVYKILNIFIGNNAIE